MTINQLDSLFEELAEVVSSKSGISISDAEKQDVDSASKEVLLLKIISNKRAKIRHGSLARSLGLTRFMGEWNFDKEIESLGYQIEELYRKYAP